MRIKMGVNSISKAQETAFQYVTSIFEGASPSLTVEDILSATMGLVERPGRRSRGNSEDDSSNIDPGVLAENELSRRKNAAVRQQQPFSACQLVEEIVEHYLKIVIRINDVAQHLLNRFYCGIFGSTSPSVNGTQMVSDSQSQQWWLESFDVILTSLKRLCLSTNRDIRCLSYEPLMILHESLNATPVVACEWSRLRVHLRSQCRAVIQMITFEICPLTMIEELEFERNDVRDVVRSVSSLIPETLATEGEITISSHT
ncbi:LOW QUALITY PROTEIN: hypothetical protein ACHAWO_009626 [Cyclotella atomus]|uniref:Uncharacterized protein n=1 Tax=Cyclotella atomus TaxID=382360 RepID=A0ABD3N245_9STRA